MQTKRAENRRKQPARDHYRDVTDKIIAALEAGVVPWRKAWDATRCGGPFNPTTRRVYRGINRILLDLCQALHEEGDPRWCSYRQALARGWQVHRGETGTRIYFFKPLEIDEAGASGDRPGEDRDDKRGIHLLRAYTVFHASQIEGMPSYVAPDADALPWRRPEAVRTILENSGADIRTGGNRAFYDPVRDIIVLPPVHAFARPDGWAATAMHEAAHWVGAKGRLDRDLSGAFGTERYAIEELRVEIAAAMVCSTLGVAVDYAKHASYIDNWLGALRRDKRAIFRAAADAQRIADYLLGFHPDYAASLTCDDEAGAEGASSDAADHGDSLLNAA